MIALHAVLKTCLPSSCSYNFVSAGTFRVNIYLEFHLVARVDLHAFLHVAHVYEQRVLVEDLVWATGLFRGCPLGFHHFLHFCLHFFWEFPEIRWLDPTISLATLRNLTEIEAVVDDLATLL